MDRNLLKIILFFPLVIFSLGCEESEPEPVDPNANFFVMENLRTYRTPPNQVNVLFQVTDENGKGIPDLVEEDFKLEEDYTAVSISESKMELKKRESLDYQIYVALLIDNSLSIGGDLEQIKNAAKAMIASMPDYQYVQLYVFSEYPILLQTFTKDIQLLESKIDDIELGSSSTNLYGSIIEALESVEPYNFSNNITVSQGITVVFTDGQDTQGSSSLSDLLSKRGDLKIYALGLGSEIDVPTMKEIGNAGFARANNIGELEGVFEKVQQDIIDFANSFYWLFYNSPKRGDNIWQGVLSLKKNSNNGFNSSEQPEEVNFPIYSHLFFSQELNNFKTSDLVMLEDNDYYNEGDIRFGSAAIREENNTSELEFIMYYFGASTTYSVAFTDVQPTPNINFNIIQNDPSTIMETLTESDFVFDNSFTVGAKKTLTNSAVMTKKYVVIHDDLYSDYCYMQINL